MVVHGKSTPGAYLRRTLLLFVRRYAPLLATAMGGGQTYRLRDDKEAEGEPLGVACLVWQCVRLSIRLGVKRTGREGRGSGGEGTGVATSRNRQAHSGESDRKSLTGLGKTGRDVLWAMAWAFSACRDGGSARCVLLGRWRCYCVVVRCFGLGSGGLLRVRCGVLVGGRHPPGRGVSPGGLGDPG